MKDGDFLKLEYTGRVSDTNEIFDLTSEELARKEGIFNPNHRYGPVLVIIGAGMVIPGVEKMLKGMKPGEEKEFDVSPEDGFGRRDVKRIKIISVANFMRQKINPVPGAFVEINGRQARIQSISGGRVRVDFNHPLAGRRLRYRVKVLESIEKPLERVKAITDYYRMDCRLKIEDGVLEITAPEKVHDAAKKLLTGVITMWVKDVRKVDFSAESEKEKEAGKEKKTGKARK